MSSYFDSINPSKLEKAKSKPSFIRVQPKSDAITPVVISSPNDNYQEILNFLDLNKVRLSLDMQYKNENKDDNQKMTLTWENINVYLPQKKSIIDKLKCNKKLKNQKQIISNGN